MSNIGCTPARGPWEYRRSLVTTLSQGAFQKGEIVALSFGRVTSLYTSSNETIALGIAMQASGNSLPAGYAVVAIPWPGCTAFVDTLSTEARSNISIGESGSIVSAGGITSTFSKLATSVWSRLVTIVSDPVPSIDSRIEVSFNQNLLTFYSTSSVSLPA